MSCISSRITEFKGISENLPLNSTIFKQFTINQCECIGMGSPNIGIIVKVDTKIIIEETKIIKTPVGTSLEGQILTGYKAIVCGYIQNIVIYVSDDRAQSVHSCTFKKCFCQFIVLPNLFQLYTSVKVIPYIEHICIPKYDSRCINICSTIFLDLITCTGCIANKTQGCKKVCANSVGISKLLPYNPMYFKEIVINDEFRIPAAKPDIESLQSITSDIEIVSSRIINTIEGTSQEGQNLTGCKLLIELKCMDLVIYTADIMSQPLYSVYFENKLLSIFIVVPYEIQGVSIQTRLESGSLKIIPYIEYICATKKDCRTIEKCLTLLLNVSI